MAFTQRYVRADAAGSGDGTTDTNSGANGAFTWAEMITDMATPRTGYRYNVKNGAFGSQGSDTFTAGTLDAHNVVAGFNSTIGDLDDLGRDSTGALVTTNMPTITSTGSMTMANYVDIMNLNITGAVSGYLWGSGGPDVWGIINCSIVNSQNNASAGAAWLDNDCYVINSDFECSGAAHAPVVIMDYSASAEMCRFKGVETNEYLLELQNGIVNRCIFHGSNCRGLYFDSAWGALANSVVSASTFYNLNTAIQLPNGSTAKPLRVSHCHVTDCSKYIDNLYSGTANATVIQHRNRTRDVTTLLTGVESIGEGSNITTDNGADTDFVDQSNGDFHLVDTAVGYAAGLHGQDIGAEQHEDAGGGGGGCKLVGPGGGMIG